MKTYIIYSEKGSFEVMASNLKAAQSAGRMNCRHTNDKFIKAKLKR